MKWMRQTHFGSDTIHTHTYLNARNFIYLFLADRYLFTYALWCVEKGHEWKNFVRLKIIWSSLLYTVDFGHKFVYVPRWPLTNSKFSLFINKIFTLTSRILQCDCIRSLRKSIFSQRPPNRRTNDLEIFFGSKPNHADSYSRMEWKKNYRTNKRSKG